MYNHAKTCEIRWPWITSTLLNYSDLFNCTHFILLTSLIHRHIAPQSVLATKNMITTKAGVIDTDYRGIVFVLLFNHLDQDLEVKQGDWITQLILEKIATPKIKQVNDLDETVRGSQGFSLTNKPQEEEKDILIAMIGKTDEGDEI